MKILHFSVLLLLAGCRATTVYEYVDEQGRLHVYSVVRDPEATFSVISKDLLLSLSGKAGSAEASTSLQLQTVMLAERLDQLNAQVMAQVKVAFFGLNANPTDPENQKYFWTTLSRAADSAQALRGHQLAHNQMLKTIEDKLVRLVDQVHAIHFDDPESKQLRERMQAELKQLDLLEAHEVNHTPSEIRVLAQSLLQYHENNLDYVIFHLPTQKVLRPLGLYILVGAYARRGRFEEAVKAVEALQAIGSVSGDKRIKAMGLLTRAYVETRKDNPNYREAKNYYDQALSVDDSFWLAHYNRACLASRLSEFKLAIDDISLFKRKSKFSSQEVERLLKDDPDKDFEPLYIQLKEDTALATAYNEAVNEVVPTK
jgi:tetratricopeptide (TPR) repeat protein